MLIDFAGFFLFQVRVPGFAVKTLRAFKGTLGGALKRSLEGALTGAVKGTLSSIVEPERIPILDLRAPK